MEKLGSDQSGSSGKELHDGDHAGFVRLDTTHTIQQVPDHALEAWRTTSCSGAAPRVPNLDAGRHLF